jgi:hypothetical protein
MGHKRRPFPKTREPQKSRWLPAGIKVANRFGMYVCEFPGPPTVWTVYDRVTGWAVGRYSPADGRCKGIGKLDGHSGTEPGFNTLFATFAELLGREIPERFPSPQRTLSVGAA